MTTGSTERKYGPARGCCSFRSRFITESQLARLYLLFLSHPIFYSRSGDTVYTVSNSTWSFQNTFHLPCHVRLAVFDDRREQSAEAAALPSRRVGQTSNVRTGKPARLCNGPFRFTDVNKPSALCIALRASAATTRDDARCDATRRGALG